MSFRLANKATWQQHFIFFFTYMDSLNQVLIFYVLYISNTFLLGIVIFLLVLAMVTELHICFVYGQQLTHFLFVYALYRSN